MISYIIHCFSRNSKNLMNSMDFFNTYHRFSGCFIFRVCTKFSSLSRKMATSSSNFPIFPLSGKKRNIILKFMKCFRIFNMNFEDISSLTIFIVVFYEILLKIVREDILSKFMLNIRKHFSLSSL